MKKHNTIADQLVPITFHEPKPLQVYGYVGITLIVAFIIIEAIAVINSIRDRSSCEYD